MSRRTATGPDGGASARPVEHRAPRQARSERTLERIVDAAEALLEERSFEEITVGDIVRRARSSVGSFYARFAGKEALLPYLYERHDRRLRQELPAVLRGQEWQRLDLAGLVERAVELLVDAYRARRGLLRAVSLYARAHPEAVGDEVRRERGVLLAGPARLFAAHRAAIRHPDPEQAVAFGIFAVAAVCREKVLFGDAPHAAATAVSDQALKEQLSRMLLAYLTCEPAAPGPPPS